MQTEGSSRPDPGETVVRTACSGYSPALQSSVSGMVSQAGVFEGVRVSASMPCRVLLVDGHSLFREGLRQLIAAGLPGWQVQAVADLEDLDDSSGGFGLAPQGSAIRCPFDLVLLDLDQRRCSAADALAEGLRRFSPVPVAVLLDRETPSQVQAICSLRPRALIHKTAGEAQMLEGLARLLPVERSSGQQHLSAEPIEWPELPSGGTPLVVGRPRGEAGPGREVGLVQTEGGEFWADSSLDFGLQSLEDLQAELSARQFDVLRLMSCGRTNKQISRELGLAESTVKTHVIAIFQKLNVSSRTEATLLASRLGLVAATPSSAG